MADQPDETPGEVFALAERGREAVRTAVKMELDYSVESLAAVDHYLSQVPKNRPEIIVLVAAMVGCYFGEVVRRAMAATWNLLATDDPARWRLDFAAIPLSINPAGMAAEAVLHDSSDLYDGALQIAPALQEALARVLEAMADVSEEYYYSLTGRLETLQHVIDVLVAQTAARNQPV